MSSNENHLARLRATLALIPILSASCGAANTPRTRTDSSPRGIASAALHVRINPGSNFGTWEGWGTSLSWWATTFGDRDDFADMFFTLRSVGYSGQNLPGLGLNVVRYNVGAATSVPINGESMQLPSTIPAFKQIDGYWLNWLNADPNSSSWNWQVDARQRGMMQRARDRGANHFELFSVSPIWWMLNNHNPTGDPNGGDNLQTWNYQQHAVYLATVAKFAHDHWGIDFQSVEPFNEPTGAWGGTWGNRQEGCHVDRDTQQSVIRFLRTELNVRGLVNTQIAASDENTYDDARATWDAFSEATKSSVQRVNVHGYQYQDGRRDLLYSEVRTAGKSLWNSEYGDGDSSGMQMARNIDLDLRDLHPTAWVYWQAADSGGWGLIQVDPSNGSLGPVNAKYFVLAQFTRHIRPGMQIIDGGDASTVAAYDPSARRLVIVTTNDATGRRINFDLSAFHVVGGVDGLVRRWATNADGHGDLHVEHEDTYVRTKAFESWFDPHTVQSFEIDNVE